MMKQGTRLSRFALYFTIEVFGLLTFEDVPRMMMIKAHLIDFASLLFWWSVGVSLCAYMRAGLVVWIWEE